MNSLAGVAMLVIGGALAGCEMSPGDNEPEPYHLVPDYSVQLGCSHCRRPDIQPHHPHPDEHRAHHDDKHHDPGKHHDPKHHDAKSHSGKSDNGKSDGGKSHKRRDER